MKKILMILSRIVGVLLIAIGLVFLAQGIYISWYFMQKGYSVSEDIALCFVSILIIYIGWRLLCIKKTIHYINKIKYYIQNREQISLEKQRIQYQKELARHEEALERAEQITNERKMVIIEEEESENMQKSNFKRKDGYIDIPLKGQRQEIHVHLCSDTDIIWKLIGILAATLIAGSLISIPVVCSVMPKEDIGIFACITIIVFWGGIFLFFGVKGHLDGDANVIFATTDQKLLYKLDLNSLFSPMTNIPTSKLGRMAYLNQKGKENESIQKTINSFLEDRKAVEEIMDELINPTKKESNVLENELKKLNSPALKRKLFGTYIKYWDENKEKWELTLLPKKTEDYHKICELIKSRKA